MKGQIIMLALIGIVGVSLFGCSSSERTEIRGQNKAIPSRKEQKSIGTPDPSAVYCTRLGYKYEIVTDEKGGQHGVCIFPDNSECTAWDFYRGKCGQEWSYCKRNGYDLKDLRRHEGWFRGATCIDRTTKEEIGTVFDLFLHRFLSESLP